MTRPMPIASLALVLLVSSAAAQDARPDAATPATTATAPRPAAVPAGVPAAAAAAPSAPGQAPVATAAAAPAAKPVLTGDAANGRLLTYTCEGCHGVPGYKNAYPNYHVPLIGGQSSGYLVNALTEYRSGARKHPTMQAQAQSFSEQDIADIAAFLSGVKK